MYFSVSLRRFSIDQLSFAQPCGTLPPPPSCLPFFVAPSITNPQALLGAFVYDGSKYLTGCWLNEIRMQHKNPSIKKKNHEKNTMRKKENSDAL